MICNEVLQFRVEILQRSVASLDPMPGLTLFWIGVIKASFSEGFIEFLRLLYVENSVDKFYFYKTYFM